MTYDTLLSDVRSYTERPNDANLDAQLPRLVMMAENRISTDLRILGTQQVVQGTFTAGLSTVAKPALWRRSISFRYKDANSNWAPLKLRTYEFCRSYWPYEGITTDAPQYYADYNFNNFLIAGPPVNASIFELTYVARLAPLGDSSQTNWYTTNAPQLLLAALLLETELWLKNQARAAQRQATYESSLNAFKGEEASRMVDRGVIVG
jgi:hypothetical protein